MSKWRSRGFVQDSEDEDESQETQRSHQDEDELAAIAPAVLQASTEADADLPEANADVGISQELGSATQNPVSGHNNLKSGIEDELSEDELTREWPARKAVLAEQFATGEGAFPDTATIPAAESAHSSPLSSLPELDDLFEFRGAQDSVQSIRNPSPQVLLSSPPPPVPKASAFELGSTAAEAKEDNIGNRHAVTEHWAAPQRNFRQRKPVQLNPYQILDGRYLQDMRSRGLRPTRIVNPSTADPHHDQEDQQSDSQSVAGSDAQSVFASPPRPQPRPRRSSAASPAEARRPASTHQLLSSSPSQNLDGDTLPSLDALLDRRHGKEKVYIGSKRRKLQHMSRPRTQSEPSELANTFDANHDALLGPATSALNEPLSPDLSPQDSQELPRLKGHVSFRMPPPALSPQKPPTPVTSSSANGTRRKMLSRAENYSSPAPQVLSSRRTRKEVTVISDDNEGSESDTERSQSGSEQDHESVQMKSVQKRIRGVLPASWLKLDVKAQHKAPTRKPDQRQHREQEDDGQQQGVARRVLKPTTSGRSLREVLGISSDEESEDEVPKATARQPAPPMHQTTLVQDTRLSSLFPDDDPGEMMEDNAVDFMMPTVARSNRQTSGTTRKRQTRVTDAFGQISKRPRGSSAHKSATKSNHKAARARNPKPPRLSILDATSSSPKKSAELPSFLKVARRQAKRQPNEGRQRPVRKNIRLQTREDTQDVQSVLGDWYAGKIRRKATQAAKSPRKRTPLMPRDPNIQQSLLPFQDDVNGNAFKAPITHTRTDYTPKRQESLNYPRPLALSTKPRRNGHQISRQLQDGQLEAAETSVSAVQDRLRFHQVVNREDEEFRTSRKPALRTLPRTLAELEAQIRRSPPSEIPPVNVGEKQAPVRLPSRTARSRRLRKAKPRQVDVETAEYRQPETFVLPAQRRSPSAPPIIDVDNVDTLTGVLRDLNPWGLSYAVNFDILPLPAGTYFHASTFVGSGALKDALSFKGRDLDTAVEPQRTAIAGRSCSWGPWTEEVSSAVQFAFAHVNRLLASALDQNVDSIPRHATSSEPAECISIVTNLINANAHWICFSDPIDRAAFAVTYVAELREMQTAIQALTSAKQDEARRFVPLVGRLVVLTVQVLKVLRQNNACLEQVGTCEKLLRSEVDSLIDYLMRHGFEGVRKFYDDNRRHAVRESGVKEEQVAVETIVVLYHSLQAAEVPGLHLWEAINARLLSSVEKTTQSGTLEHTWLNLLTPLPLLEVSIDGVYRTGLRFQVELDNWEVPRKLLARAFDLYGSTVMLPSTTMNDYIRALLLRCHHLVQSWAWKRCESIISLAFDFFAKREYMSLVKEDKFGSPSFLEQLHAQPSLDVGRDEKAFHIFLKLVAIGFRGLRQVYSEKRIRSIVWRWLPNHSRTYDKERDLRKEDLDALRNQHDLLSTLYWASPPTTRPCLQLVQNLVDHTSSHLEAIRISIKTWSNLAAFQLSTDEPISAVEPFAVWSVELLEQNITQYKSARPELEAQHEASKRNGVATVSTDRLETMILRNQSGIIGALTDAISGLRTAFKTAKSLSAAWTLLHGCNVPSVFTLFDAKQKKTNAIILGVLSMFDAFLDLAERSSPAAESQTTNDDSQDYGDWPDEEDVAPAKSVIEEALDYVLEQAAHLLSSIFGSETTPEDELLNKMVEHWTRLATILVRRKIVSYDTFLSEYGKHTWTQLRDTAQRRKFGAYFLSCLLKHDRSVIFQHRQQIMSTWLCSLAERDAQLKFQHVLTSELLNSAPDDPLLQNLPFTKAGETGSYDISTQELRERRLALLSSVLANMRDDFHNAMQHDPASVRSLRAEYNALLQQLMGQMRHNYEALKQGDVVTGAYVTFVQTMIGFMQQYTADICPIDKYFTDSAAFPLPTGDPTYLVGKLKSYETKLNDPKNVKHLIAFMQNISERAAVDNEQQYLESQLCTAMVSDLRHDAVDKGTLRSALLRIILPAYIECSTDDAAGWVVARPMLKICDAVFNNVLYKISATNVANARAIISFMSCILESCSKAIAPLEWTPERLCQAQVMVILGLMLKIATTCLPTLDYLRRRIGVGEGTTRVIDHLKQFSLFTAKVVLHEPDALPPSIAPEDTILDPKTAELRAFCSKQLQQDLQTKWRMVHGRIEVKRGTEWSAVVVKIGDANEEMALLIRRIEEFHEALDRTKTF